MRRPMLSPQARSLQSESARDSLVRDIALQRDFSGRSPPNRPSPATEPIAARNSIPHRASRGTEVFEELVAQTGLFKPMFAQQRLPGSFIPRGRAVVSAKQILDEIGIVGKP